MMAPMTRQSTRPCMMWIWRTAQQSSTWLWKTTAMMAAAFWIGAYSRVVHAALQIRPCSRQQSALLSLCPFCWSNPHGCMSSINALLIMY